MGLRFLSLVVALGVVVDNIPSLFLGSNFFNDCNALSLTGTLQHLVAGMGCYPNEASHGIERLTINDTSSSVYFIPIMTAAQVSISLRTVQVHIVEDQLDEHVLDLWRCLAYTLLSSDADHNITRLELELSDFHVEHVNAIRAVLEASRSVLPTIAGANVFDQLSLLPAADHPSSLLEQPSQRLTCSKVFLFDPRCDNRAEYAINEFAATDLRVIHDENTDDCTRTVLLPGWGKGWVQDQREAVSTEEELFSIQSHAQNTRSFRELSILDINEASMPAATTQMSLIGSQVELLEINARDDGTAFDAWLVAVLPHFPSLRRLKIKRGRIINPGTLMDILGTAERGIQSLMLDRDISNFNTEEISRFFYALEDRHRPMGISLDELELRFEIYDGIFLALRGFCDALQQNRRLHTVRLNFGPATDPATEDAIMSFLSTAVSAMPICRVAPLGIHHKHAFLSLVLQCGEVMPRPASLQHLDNAIITNIFQFAGQGKRHEFRIHFAACLLGVPRS